MASNIMEKKQGSMITGAIHKDEGHKAKDVPQDTKQGAPPADMNNTKLSEDQWQTQRRKNFKGNPQNTQKKQEKSKQVYKPIQAKVPGIDSTTPICNIDTGVQDQCPNPLISSTDDALKLQRNYEQKATGIDSMLPTPMAPPNYNSIIIVDDAVVNGGMDGMEEQPTNMQEGVSKGGNLSHVLHESQSTDLRCDSRAPATTINSCMRIHLNQCGTDSLVLKENMVWRWEY
ncbi:hypothetical protein HAX54_047555 [Datura stramonium]|uniref:Uncharacterized protein n=1 Tax=Datura stramonium TaxID=4076 RepID=A0ABS8RQL1_DATST|nr:hypothetical protein [Datura stramonium]